MARLKPWDVDEESWAVIEPRLPQVERRARHPGRKRHPDRLVSQSILFVRYTGIAAVDGPHMRALKGARRRDEAPLIGAAIRQLAPSDLRCHR